MVTYVYILMLQFLFIFWSYPIREFANLAVFWETFIIDEEY